MENNQSTQPQENIGDRDPQVWEIAKRRVAFKNHLATYIIINAFFWVIWFFNNDRYESPWPWPIWPMFGWGIGLTFHFLAAYVFPQQNSVEREYDKMMRNKK